ncbi:MAG: hypothetical protein JO264_17045 [Acidisphaera sp.]|nr:hypothetical protein [Acidisphaera sp.]
MPNLLSLPVLVPALLLALLGVLARVWHPPAPSGRPLRGLEPEAPEAEPDDLALEPDETPLAESLLDDSRVVEPAEIILVWQHGAAEPQEYAVRVDTVSRDQLVFEGLARRPGETEGERRLFHTMDMPYEHLVSARTEGGKAIPDMRSWLAGLPEVTP